MKPLVSLESKLQIELIQGKIVFKSKKNNSIPHILGSTTLMYFHTLDTTYLTKNQRKWCSKKRSKDV